MPEPRIRTTIEFDPYDFERLRAYADKQDVGLATAIIGLLDGKGVRIPFTPPSVEDVKAHSQEKGYTFDAEAFHAYYAARGWKLSGQMMRNWKAACVTWQKREPAAPAPSKAAVERETADQRRKAEVLAELEQDREERRKAGLL